MADHILTGNITGNIGIKTGNFPLAVALNKQVTGFTASNVMLGGSITGVGFTVSGEGKDYHVNITLPTNIDLSSFTVDIVGSVMVDGVSESIEDVNQKTVHYDTQSTISAVFDDPEYTELEDNLLIRVPVMFGDPGQTEIVGLDRTDFSLHRLLGDEIFDFDYYITGSGLSYVINIIPTIDKQGAFSLDIVGHVLKADGIENEVVLNHAVILYYDTRTPNLIDFEMQTAPADGSPFSVYLDFDIPTTGLLPQDSNKIIYEGITNYGQPILYYAEEVDDENKLPPQDSRTASNLPTNRDHPYDDNTVEARFFRLEFQSYDILPGEILNIRIKEGAVKGPSGEPVDSLQQQSGIQQRSSRAVARQTQTLTVIEVYWLGSNNQGPSNFFAIDFNVGTATPSINDMTFSGEVYLDGVLQDTLNSDDVVGLFQVANGFAIRFNLPDFDYFFVRLQIDAGVIEPDLASVLPHADIDVTLTDGDGDPPDPVDPIDPVDPLDEIIPTISIADTQIERGESTTATITFPSAHSGFALNDLSVNFGSLSSFNIVNSLTYTVNITAPLTSSGDIILTLAADALTGNTNPEVTATVSWSAPPFGDIVWIVPTSPVSPIFTSELRFDVPVSAPVVNDIRMRTGAALAFQLTSQNTTITSIAGTNNYLISVDASADVTGSASYFFRLRPNTISYDGSDYPAVNFDSSAFTIDDSVGQIASFTITTTPTVVVSGVPVVFNIASNIVVNGLTNADITVVGGVAEPIQGSGSAYTVRVTPPSTGSGSITLTIAENAVDELNDETSHSVNYSPLVIPEAVMTVSITETSVVGGSFVTVNVSSNISVSGLTINDFTTTRGTLSNFQSLGGNQYSLRLTLPSTGSGNARVTLAADSVNEGNNTASDVVSYAPAVVPEAVMTVSITETSANVGDVVVVNVGSNITVSGLTIDDFTTTRGTLDNFQSLGNNMYSLDLTLPLTGSGNARVRLLADSVNEGNNAATDVVAYSTPTFFIEPIAEQNITIGTDWGLDVNITGDPDDAYVRGELAGFGWDYSNGVLSIIGTPDELASNKTFTVYARKGSSTIHRSAIYNVIRAAPVIDIFGPWTMVKGVTFSEDIIIRNNPTTVVVSGHWFFLDQEKTPEGVKVFGEIPPDPNLTIEEGMITCVASNDVLTVSRDGVINISDDSTASSPRNLTLTSNTTGVRLNWLPPLDNGGQNILRYQYAQDSGFGFGNWINAGNNLNEIITLTTDGIYRYKVRAVTSIGNGDESNIVSISWASVTVPGAPTNLSASSVTGGIRISFTPSSNDGGATVIRHEYSQNGAGWVNIGLSTSYTVFLSSSGTYSYRVRSVNSAGNSLQSALASAFYQAVTVPGAPTNLSASSVTGGIRISFTPSSNDGGATVIRHEYSQNGAGWVNIGLSTSRTISLFSSGNYSYRVRSVNSVGNSLPSGSASAFYQAVTVPGAPTNLSIFVTSVQFSVANYFLSWIAPINTGGSGSSLAYELSINNGSFFDIGTGTTHSSGLHSSLVPIGATTFFQVRSYNSAGTSSPGSVGLPDPFEGF